jgi:hypothetical protein
MQRLASGIFWAWVVAGCGGKAPTDVTAPPVAADAGAAAVEPDVAGATGEAGKAPIDPALAVKVEAGVKALEAGQAMIAAAAGDCDRIAKELGPWVVEQQPVLTTFKTTLEGLEPAVADAVRTGWGKRVVAVLGANQEAATACAANPEAVKAIAMLNGDPASPASAAEPAKVDTHVFDELAKIVATHKNDCATLDRELGGFVNTRGGELQKALSAIEKLDVEADRDTIEHALKPLAEVSKELESCSTNNSTKALGALLQRAVQVPR